MTGPVSKRPWSQTAIPAARRWIVLPLALALLGGAAGYVAATSSPASAEALLLVRTDAFDNTSQQLAAENAAVELDTLEVFTAAAKKTGGDPRDLKSRTEIAAVPNSQTVSLSVTAATQEQAVADASAVFDAALAAGPSRTPEALEQMTKATRDLIESSFPAASRQATGPDADPCVVPAREPGSLVRVDRAGLVAAARRADCVLELVPVVGDFVSGGAPLFRVHPGPRRAGDVAGPAARLRAEEIARLVLVGPERVHTEDASYGLRKLVDVAERSIAQPFNDPTTTLQALHRLHDLLRQLAARPLPAGEHRDEDGVVRLVERTLSWDGYVRLAFDEIRLAGATSPQVTRRLCAALQDLKIVAPANRQAPLDRQLRLLTAAVHRAYEDDEDIVAALTPDAEGIGSGADVTTAVRLDRGTADADVRPGARIPG